MAGLKYSYTVDVENPTTSHSQAVLLVTPGSKVLDIGAADGSVARALAARGCRVWGVELDPAAAARARSACERVFVGNVEELDLEALLEGQRFDYILYLDVLEHLRDPLAVLTRAHGVLAAGGRIVASIPNVTHGAVRLSLMSGAFTYTETGLLDKTHLRFFDRRGAEGLFTDARLRIVERLRVSRELTETEIAVNLASVPPALLEQLRGDPDATTYQFLFVAIPAESANAATLAAASLAERLQHRVEETEANYRQLESYARSLEQQSRELGGQVESLTSHAGALERDLRGVRTELDAVGHAGQSVAQALQEERQRTDDERSAAQQLRTELERRIEELTMRHLELRHLQADLAVKEAFIAKLRRTLVSNESEKEAVIAKMRLEGREAKLTAALAAMRDKCDRRGNDLSRTRAELHQLRVFVNSPGFRTVASAARTLSKYPRTYRFLRRIVRGVASKPSA